MEIKDIIEKLEEEKNKARAEIDNKVVGLFYEGKIVLANRIIRWIKSNGKN